MAQSEYLMIHKRKSSSVILSLFSLGFLVLFCFGFSSEWVKWIKYNPENVFAPMRLIPWFSLGYLLFLGLSTSVLLLFKIPKRIEEDGLLRRAFQTFCWGHIGGLVGGIVSGIIFTCENGFSEIVPSFAYSITFSLLIFLSTALIIGIYSGIRRDFREE